MNLKLLEDEAAGMLLSLWMVHGEPCLFWTIFMIVKMMHVSLVSILAGQWKSHCWSQHSLKYVCRVGFGRWGNESTEGWWSRMMVDREVKWLYCEGPSHESGIQVPHLVEVTESAVICDHTKIPAITSTQQSSKAFGQNSTAEYLLFSWE